jgi:hypothetical protein
MSRTIRRKKYEQQSPSKKGSSVAGYYTAVDLIEKEDPNNFQKRMVFEYNPSFENKRKPKFQFCGWEDTSRPAKKWIESYREPTARERFDTWKRIHADHHRSWSVSKISRKIEESHFRSIKKKAISTFLKTSEDFCLPDFPKGILD